MRKFIYVLCVVLFAFGIARLEAMRRAELKEPQAINVGYFANITHSQALVGISQGQFRNKLGDKVEIKTNVFNAGPSEIEALFAGQIDLGYIGPSPAINGYIKSQGEALRIVSGAASAGASLVVQPALYDAYKKSGAGALEGKKIASPQQGNTQDISLRHFLKDNGLSEKTEIVPIANADQLTMFTMKQIDGAWAPEPWASRLVQEAGGKRLIDERDLWPGKSFCTTNIIVRTGFLEEHPDLVRKWLQAHNEVTDWIDGNPEQAQAIVNSEIERLTSKKLSSEVLKEAWGMLNFTVDPIKSSVMTFADWAFEQGFLGESKPDLGNIYDLSILNEITNKQY
jgi:NitT/TauT family transport system substrate-binding protein